MVQECTYTRGKEGRWTQRDRHGHIASCRGSRRIDKNASQAGARTEPGGKRIDRLYPENERSKEKESEGTRCGEPTPRDRKKK